MRDDMTKRLIFQSTLPIQGETKCILYIRIIPEFQSTLPIQGETIPLIPLTPTWMYFNPLSLYRERPVLCTSRQYISCISIHSPYTGRDRDVPEYWDDDSISIHSPYTGRDWVIWNRHYPVPRFQSTLPIQGETAC